MREDRIGKLEERIEDLTRRVDTLAMALCCSDAENPLSKMEILEKRIDSLVWHLVLNDNEARIFRDILAGIQREIHKKQDKPDSTKP